MFFVDICKNFKHKWVRNVSRRSGHQIIFHALHLKEGRNVNVTIFSPSGDTDITVSLLAGHVDGHGEDKKIKWD